MRRAAWVFLAFAACAHGRQVPSDDTVIAEGIASYYGPGLAGRPTANGEVFDPSKLTAAHRTVRLGSCLSVENVANGRQVQVRVNDRGPYAGGRIIDVSQAAAGKLGMLQSGVARVRLRHCR